MFSMRTRGGMASLFMCVSSAGLLENRAVLVDVRLRDDRDRHRDILFDRLLVDQFERSADRRLAFAFRILLDDSGNEARVDTLDGLRAQIPADDFQMIGRVL